MHDYDNHHWYKMSIFGALLSDIYVRAHRHSMPYIDALLPHPTFTVPIGVTQWQRRFLFKSIDKILHAHRTERPGGRHRLYPRFELRNRMIATFALCAPEVGFTDCARFNNQSQEEKLEDWLTTKVQLCAPVGNDIPIRFFDSLITGGLPAIPERSEEAVRGIGVPEEHFISFGPIELANPAATVHAWSERFDKLGQAGIIARLSHCIEHFHIDHTIKKLLHLVFTLASSKQSRDTTTV
jgi:hypothetical protein